MKDSTTRSKQAEVALKSSWHALIAGVGVYELRNHRTRLSKILACGLILFHADAAICDWLDVPTTPQRFFQKVLDKRSEAC